MALSSALISNGNGGLAVEVRPHIVEMFFKITASGNYATGGDTLDLTAVTGAPGVTLPPTSQLPLLVEVKGQAGYDYEYAAGTSQANGKLLVRQCAGSGNPQAELSSGAYPAGVTGDTIIARASFLRG